MVIPMEDRTAVGRRAERDDGFEDQVLYVPDEFFRDAKAIFEMMRVVSEYVRDKGFRAKVVDYDFLHDYGETFGNVEIVFCCEHGYGVGRGISLSRSLGAWTFIGEWDDFPETCPFCR